MAAFTLRTGAREARRPVTLALKMPANWTATPLGLRVTARRERGLL